MIYGKTTATDKILTLRKRIRGVSGGTSASKTISILIWVIARAGSNLPDDKEIIREAKKIIQALNLDNKIQVIRDIITKVIVKGGQLVQVRGRLPLFALNMGYEPTSRDSGSS